MICSGILSDHKDGPGKIEVLQRNGSLPDADRFGQRRATGFVAHVRAVRKVVCTKLSDKELIEKSGFIARASRGVENCLVRMIE